MEEGQYINPVELVAVVGFVLLPALALALAVQAYFLRRTGMWKSSPGRATVGLAGTVVLAAVAALVVLAFAPASLGAFLRIRELNVAGQHWLVWPAGFALAGVSAVLTTYLLNRRAKSAA